MRLGLRDFHIANGAAHGEGRNRPIVLDHSTTFRGSGDRDERSYLEAALTGVPISGLVRVRYEGGLVFRLTARQEFTIPRLVDLSRVGRRRPVRDTPGADNRDSLGGPLR